MRSLLLYWSGSKITLVSEPSSAFSICVSSEIWTISASPWNSVASSSPALASLLGLSRRSPNSIFSSSNAMRFGPALRAGAPAPVSAASAAGVGAAGGRRARRATHA